MAQKKTAENDFSMQEKIEALYDLQKIDSQIDEINKIKGELPLEVQDLEDDIAGLTTRLENLNGEVQENEEQIKLRKLSIEEAQRLIARYKEQLDNVANNREYDSLSKEIEFQEYEIQFAEKKIKECNNALKDKKTAFEATEAQIAERQVDLDAKKAELESIEKETEAQVSELQAAADVARVKIDDRLLTAYNRIRSKVHNGLAVVTVKRNACSGCFNHIPPQRQADVDSGKKLIVCEYCGRILVPSQEVAE